VGVIETRSQVALGSEGEPALEAGKHAGDLLAGEGPDTSPLSRWPGSVNSCTFLSPMLFPFTLIMPLAGRI
jgi:hypothetical protein